MTAPGEKRYPDQLHVPVPRAESEPIQQEPAATGETFRLQRENDDLRVRCLQIAGQLVREEEKAGVLLAQRNKADTEVKDLNARLMQMSLDLAAAQTKVEAARLNAEKPAPNKSKAGEGQLSIEQLESALALAESNNDKMTGELHVYDTIVNRLISALAKPPEDY